MKITLIIVIVLLIIFGFYSRKKQQDILCMNMENYELLRESPYADQLCKYKIIREEKKIRFTTKDGYTLFFITPESKDNNLEVVLIGLDGYGVRDKEFKKYICELIEKIKKESDKK